MTPISVVVHGVGETRVEGNGPQAEGERMCGPKGGRGVTPTSLSMPPYC